jgi:hypothetical protein
MQLCPSYLTIKGRVRGKSFQTTGHFPTVSAQDGVSNRAEPGTAEPSLFLYNGPGKYRTSVR